VEIQIKGIIKDLQKNLDLRENLQNEWAKAQEIKEFKNENNGLVTYVQYNPKHLAIKGISTVKDTAFIKAQIQAYPKISFNKKIEPNTEFTPFPKKNKLKDDFDKGFNINFEIDIPYQEIIEKSKSKFKNKSLNIEFKIFKKNKIKTRISRLKDFKIYAHEDKLIFGLCLKGFVRGLVFIQGVPKYDVNKGIIYLEGLEWTSTTKRNLSLLKLIDLTLNEKLKERLNLMIRYNLASEVRPKIEELNKKYFNQDKGLILNGKLVNVALTDIFPHDNELKVFVNIGAEVEGVTLD